MPALRVGSLMLMACAACTPKTDLAAERGGPGTPSDGGRSGATPALVGLPELVDPPANARLIPPNLAKVILRFLGPLQVPDGAAPLTLRASDGSEVALALADMVTCAGTGTCYAAPPSGGLASNTLYTVEVVADALHMENGKPVPAGSAGSFTTADGPDEFAPLVSGFEMSVSEGCVHAHFVTDEAAWATIVVTGGAEVAVLELAGGIASKFDVASRFPNLPAGVDGQALVRAVDRAGNQSDSAAVALHLPPKVPRLVITEVQGNPAGSEYTQEFVEVKNLEADPVSLAGMFIEDKTGSDVLPDLAVPPSGFALLVAANFVLDDGKDPVPRDGTVIARVSGRLGADGLSNAGEPVRLVSGDGTVVSEYGGWVDVSATAWNGMSVQRISVDSCDQASAWTSTPQMPTPGW